MSAEQLITDHLDLWTSAVTYKSGRGAGKGRELTGIRKLRELILELAVRGKLVDQDPNDEPASMLLEKIAEKKKGKNSKNVSEVIKEEKPFKLPSGWEWFRVGNYLEFQYGKALAAKDRNESGGIDVYGSNGVVGKHDRSLTEDACIVIGRKGSAGALRKALTPSWVTDVAYFLIPPTEISFDYCYLLLISLKLDTLGKGIKPGVNRNEAYSLIAALPPLEEQHRIVAKASELMALCDCLEQQTGDQLDAHEVLVDTLLNALTRAENSDEVAAQWARLAEHFDTLFTTEASIDKLKQTILQLAVMGRLVVQDPNDEPASVLLEKIAAKKARLVEAGEIKKQKRLSSPSDKTSCTLPQGWQWEKLGNFTLVGTGATPSRGRADYYTPPQYPWVTSGETNNTYIFDTKEKISPAAVRETNITIYPEGTLIVAMYGQGKTRGQISELKVAAGTNQACAAIRLLASDINHRRYIKLCFIKLYDEIREGAAGGAQPNLNTGKIANTLIPLPPLAEQHRIVAEVDELMALCDQLKARLSDASETRTHLAEAVVTQAVE